MTERALQCVLAVLVMLVTGCATVPSPDGPPATGTAVPGRLPPDAIPREEPRSQYGNPPFYEVYGTRYQVLESSYGFRQRGVASWYGNKFHGKATSSQEPYDMYAMTAAHKTLPLPTYVRVRNLRNNRSVVVRVNDRGPFVDNRIIDLSYSAALKLDMIREGTSLVEITALSYDAPPEDAQDVPTRVEKQAPARENEIFVQVGAFGDAENAKRRYALLREHGIQGAFVHKDTTRKPALYRIRIGPIDGVADYDDLVARLRQIGIEESHLVTR